MNQRDYIPSVPLPPLSLHTINYRLQSRTDLPALKDAMTVFNSSKRNGYWSSDPELTPNLYEGAQILYALELHKKNIVDMERHRQLMKDYVKAYDPNSTVEPSRSYYQYHPFLLYIAVRALTVNTPLANKLLHRINECFFNEISYQLAFKSAADEHNFDPIRLGWATAGLLKTKCNWKPRTIEHARDLFMECHLPTGIWPVSQIVLSIGKELISCSGLQLLFELIMLSPSAWLLQHIEKIEKLFHWLKSHEIQRCGVSVWRADVTSLIPLWFNLLVLDLLHTIDLKLAQAISDDAISRLPASIGKTTVSWSNLIDTGFKKPLESKIIEPLRKINKDVELIESDRAIILFGPPGSAKTSVARALAEALGQWPLVELSPVDFCIQGIENIFARSKKIFDALLELKNVVILFDEIDELVSMRETEPEKIGRFLTTAMLPWFQNLHDCKSVVYIVNTNDVSRYDVAIRRPARFDLVLPVGLPDRKQQKDFLLNKLKDKGINETQISAILDEIHKPRTVPELVDLCEILKKSTVSQWETISKQWNEENPPSTNNGELTKFDEHIKKYTRY